MTRSDAEMQAIRAVGFEWSEDARRTIAILETLGLLKLDQPKGSNERAVDAMFSYPPCNHGLITPRHAIEALEAAGLMIVDNSCRTAK